MARAPMAENWWSIRFLEGMADGDHGRLARGRTYARNGSVGQITISPETSTVTAHVSGSRANAYRVSIAFQMVGEHLWDRILSELGQDPDAVAALLDGVDEVFARHGVVMFPESVDDLDMRCTCPDWGYPCKHAAAVLYSLAQVFDDQPLALLAWLGRTEEEVLAALGTSITDDGPAGELDVEVRPLAECVDDFWAPADPVPMSPPRPFDPLAHWEGGTPGVASRLRPMYALLERPDS